MLLFRKVWDAVSGEDILTLAHKHIVKSVNFTQVGGMQHDNYIEKALSRSLNVKCCYVPQPHLYVFVKGIPNMRPDSRSQ